MNMSQSLPHIHIPQNAKRSPKMPFSASLRLCARKKEKGGIALRRRDAEKRFKDKDFLAPDL